MFSRRSVRLTCPVRPVRATDPGSRGIEPCSVPRPRSFSPLFALDDPLHLPYLRPGGDPRRSPPSLPSQNDLLDPGVSGASARASTTPSRAHTWRSPCKSGFRVRYPPLRGGRLPGGPYPVPWTDPCGYEPLRASPASVALVCVTIRGPISFSLRSYSRSLSISSSSSVLAPMSRISGCLPSLSRCPLSLLIHHDSSAFHRPLWRHTMCLPSCVPFRS